MPPFPPGTGTPSSLRDAPSNRGNYLSGEAIRDDSEEAENLNVKKEPSRLFPKPHLQSLSEKHTEREATVGAKVPEETKHTSDEMSVR